MNGCRSEADLVTRMNLFPVKHVGNSDSGLMFSRFQELFMGAPTVVIERDLDDVAASLEAQLGKELCEQGGSRAFLEKQHKRLQSVSGLRVPFDDINARLEEIHQYLVSVPFDSEYAQDMTSQNRQVTEMTVDLESSRFWLGGV